MKDKKYSTHLGIINSEKWKQLRAYFNQYTFEYNNFDYSKTENEVIEYLRILYSNIDKQLNNALEYLQTNGNISILEKNKILAYSKELNKLKFECEQKLISLNSKPLDYELLFFDNMDLVEPQKKKVLEDANKIQLEFNSFIKIEAQETKKNSKLKYPDFFKNLEGFLIFSEFIENDIADPLTDFSFIFQNLKHDKYIHDIKQKTFYNWLFESNYIKENELNKILINNGFKPKSKCFSEKRFNKYLKLKEKHSNTDSE